MAVQPGFFFFFFFFVMAGWVSSYGCAVVILSAVRSSWTRNKALIDTSNKGSQSVTLHEPKHSIMHFFFFHHTERASDIAIGQS